MKAQRIVNFYGLLMVAAALACSSGTDEGDGFQQVIGKYCPEETHSSAVDTGAGWDVSVWYNRVTYIIVTDKHGVLRQQEVRGCLNATVVGLTDPSIQDEGDAITFAGWLLEVNPIY